MKNSQDHTPKMEDSIVNTQLDAYEKELAEKDSKISELGSFAASSIYAGTQDTNLITWQLELDNILERIEHLLKGDILEEDSDGNVKYIKAENKDLVVLNDYGVQLIMNLVSFYLNRNTILSNYKELRIYEILYDLGNELADLMYINYEKMGLNTIEKKSRSAVLGLNILHILESAYNRALEGAERDSLRSARVVTQTVNQQPNQQPQPQRSRFSWNPFKRA